MKVIDQTPWGSPRSSSNHQLVHKKIRSWLGHISPHKLRYMSFSIFFLFSTKIILFIVYVKKTLVMCTSLSANYEMKLCVEKGKGKENNAHQKKKL